MAETYRVSRPPRRVESDVMGRQPLEFEKFDKTAVRAFDSFEAADAADRKFWLSRTPEERLQALEHMRQLARGYDDHSRPKFEKIIRIRKLRRRVPSCRRKASRVT